MRFIEVKQKKVFVKVNGELKETTNPELIGLAVLDQISVNTSKSELTDVFVNYLESKGGRKTPERFTILKAVSNQKKPFTVNSIHKEIEDILFLSHATVYNTIKLLLECGIITRSINSQNELFKTTYFELKINYIPV